MQVGSLFMALGFDVDDKKLDEFSDKVGGLRKGLLGVAGTAAAGVAALSAMSMSASNTAMDVRNVADQIRLSSDEVRQFYAVLQGAYPRASMQDALGILTALRDTIVDFELGEGASGIAALLGLEPNQIAQMNEMELLSAVRGVVGNQSFSREKTDQLIEQLGLPRDFVRLFRMPEQQFQELLDRPRLQDEYQNNLEELAFATGELTYYFGLLKDTIGGIAALPLAQFFRTAAAGAEDLSRDISQGTVDDTIKSYFAGVFGNMLDSLRKSNVDANLELMKNMEPERYKEYMMRQNIQSQYNTTNNFNVETTADPREVAEQIINLSNENQNRGDIAEFPNTAGGGIR